MNSQSLVESMFFKSIRSTEHLCITGRAPLHHWQGTCEGLSINFINSEVHGPINKAEEHFIEQIMRKVLFGIVIRINIQMQSTYCNICQE